MDNNLDLSAADGGFDRALEREWLVANGIGGYASSTLPGLNTRKYHGLLVAAMAPPVRRMVLLSRVEETVRADGWPSALACNEYPGAIHPEGHLLLRAFDARPFPRWAYQADGWTLEKTLRVARGANTVVLTYTLLAGGKPVELELRPLLALRPIHALMYQWNGAPPAETRGDKLYRVPATARTPEAFFAHDGAFRGDGVWYLNQIYRAEQSRGYAGLEDLWSPGAVKWTLAPGQSAHFVCSSDPVDLDAALTAVADGGDGGDGAAAGPPAPRVPPSENLGDREWDALRAAVDAFAPAGAASSSSAIVTSFPWSPPGGRDALVAVPGMLLTDGGPDRARALLLATAARLRDGLVPSLYAEETGDPLRAAADVSLWLANAAHAYHHFTADDATAAKLLHPVLAIVDAYRRGTPLGIFVDPDGLLNVGSADGGAWMDARCGDAAAATPRAGLPVEVNALWYNAVCVAAELSERFGSPVVADELGEFSKRIRGAFNARFWNPDAGCCFDVVTDGGKGGGGDTAVRPHQLLAASLPYPVLFPDRFAAVLGRVERDLMTPFGPRTLAPSDPDYHGRYAGGAAQRDRAHHQGSVAPWLLGAYASAVVRTRGHSPATRRQLSAVLRGCVQRINGDGFGLLCELFDGDAPHRPGGAVASLAAAAEVLRAYAVGVRGVSVDRFTRMTASSPDTADAIKAVEPDAIRD